MDAFDADVLIDVANGAHRAMGVTALFDATVPASTGIGSVVLVPEVLTKPIRTGDDHEEAAMAIVLGRLELLPTSRAVAYLAAKLGAKYGLRAADAIHLATAVDAGADRFITNNRRDFPRSIEEIAVTYPEDLVAASR